MIRGGNPQGGNPPPPPLDPVPRDCWPQRSAGPSVPRGPVLRRRYGSPVSAAVGMPEHRNLAMVSADMIPELGTSLYICGLNTGVALVAVPKIRAHVLGRRASLQSFPTELAGSGQPDSRSSTPTRRISWLVPTSSFWWCRRVPGWRPAKARRWTLLPTWTPALAGAADADADADADATLVPLRPTRFPIAARGRRRRLLGRGAAGWLPSLAPHGGGQRRSGGRKHHTCLVSAVPLSPRPQLQLHRSNPRFGCGVVRAPRGRLNPFASSRLFLASVAVLSEIRLAGKTASLVLARTAAESTSATSGPMASGIPFQPLLVLSTGLALPALSSGTAGHDGGIIIIISEAAYEASSGWASGSCPPSTTARRLLVSGSSGSTSIWGPTTVRPAAGARLFLVAASSHGIQGLPRPSRARAAAPAASNNSSASPTQVPSLLPTSRRRCPSTQLSGLQVSPRT
ncbi:non-anchored cell wall protein 1 [Diplocarpon mali]|nr:non-anchored cell wall protein 1 [Diplocarpon mali]